MRCVSSGRTRTGGARCALHNRKVSGQHVELDFIVETDSDDSIGIVAAANAGGRQTSTDASAALGPRRVDYFLSLPPSNSPEYQKTLRG